ncbi:MAG: cytochrome c biogenesis protein ResB [Desulfuromonadales bacterium]|nr:cytochrome c biogenesis protein ResB [Desulfuromonadales bacterium]
MKNGLHAAWRLFASVKLALISLFVLAAASIIGTVIKQGQSPAYYVEEYGQTLAWLIQLLEIPNLYSSWWFVALLALFALNLVVCSCERLPVAWRLVVHDNLATAPEVLERMNLKHRFDTALATGAAADRMQQLLAGGGWNKPKRLDREGSTLLFAQRGAWTRLGVHLVHLSILVILAGAMIGTWFGFKGYVILPEGRSTTQVYLQGNREAVPLGFELWYDRFEKANYPNGQIREYRSDLTVFNPEGGTPKHKSSVVNDPLQHRGLSFYIADNYPLEEYFVVLRNSRTGREQAFRIPPDRQVAWQGTDIVFGIEELRRDQEGAVQQAKIRFSDTTSDPSVFWMHNKDTVTIQRPAGEFTLSLRQLHSTLFLVTKDPGVWLIWIGSLLMVVGLCVSFCLSHQRLWVSICATGKKGARILVSGTSNKNQPAFEGRFQELVHHIQSEEHGTPNPYLAPAAIGRTVKKAI